MALYAKKDLPHSSENDHTDDSFRLIGTPLSSHCDRLIVVLDRRSGKETQVSAVQAVVLEIPRSMYNTKEQVVSEFPCDLVPLYPCAGKMV